MAHNTPNTDVHSGTTARSVLDYVNFAKGGVNTSNPRSLANTTFSSLKDFWRQYVNTGGDPSNNFPNGLTAANADIKLSHFKNAQYFEVYIAHENLSNPGSRFGTNVWKSTLSVSLKHPDIGSLAIENQTYNNPTYSRYLFNDTNGSEPHYLQVGVKSGSTYVGQMFFGVDAYDSGFFEVPTRPTSNPATIKPSDALNSTNPNDLSVTWVHDTAGTFTLELIAKSYATNAVLASGTLTLTQAMGPTGVSSFTGTSTCCTDGTTQNLVWSNYNTARDGAASDWHVITLGTPCMKIDSPLSNCLRRCGSIFSIAQIPNQ